MNLCHVCTGTGYVVKDLLPETVTQDIFTLQVRSNAGLWLVYASIYLAAMLVSGWSMHPSISQPCWSLTGLCIHPSYSVYAHDIFHSCCESVDAQVGAS
jgi:hypothetical protein